MNWDNDEHETARTRRLARMREAPLFGAYTPAPEELSSNLGLGQDQCLIDDHPNTTTMRALACDLGDHTREQFIAEHPDHFLVQQSWLSRRGENRGYFTLTPVGSAQPCDLLSTTVYILRKTAGDAFQDMITLGRASNNDVVIKYSCVSKFHACFTRIGSCWSFMDSGSTNGTILNGKAMKARVGEVILPDSEITFSSKLTFKFVNAAKLFNYLDYFRRHVGVAD